MSNEFYEKYCRKIATRILAETNQFDYYVAPGRKQQAKKIFEGMGLRVREGAEGSQDISVNELGNDLLLLEVSK